MKKLSKIALKNQGNVLSESEMQKILGGGSYTCYCSYWSWGGCGCEHVDTDDLGIDVGSYIAQFCRGSSNCTLHDPYGGCVGTCL